MAKIVYKTRAGIEPTGLERVWLSAHPLDVRDFLSGAAEKILSAVNCAIWYDAEPTESYDTEDLLDNLSRMQLFVIPVTERFLTEENRALSVELPYAIENRIPVLPLIEDEALASLFNEKCGCMQYLSPAQKDETGISYDEKLKKFLSSVLLGDKLAEQVRDAFDAYIFLSYRKKDRKYANELMRLIHRNDFCRDIAIWYDEFLTPGENFNEAIAKAMKKSALFALAVTPSILESDNYVLTNEYPMALKSGLCILPAEMIKTDREELRAKYPSIPEPKDAYDTESLSPALSDALSNIAIRANDSDPVHNFFIGLAYLGGIDVETDRDRAIELIMGASEAGLPEATEKLIGMYETGDGVMRNLDAALSMAERLAQQTEAIYLRDASVESFNRYMNAIFGLIERHSKEGRAARAAEVCDRYREAAKGAFGKFDGEAERWYINAIGRKGRCLSGMGDYSSAIACYEEYLSEEANLMPENAEKPNADRALTYASLASASSSIGDYRTSGKWCKKTEEAIAQLESDCVTDDVAERISACYNRLADLARSHFQLEKALDYGKKSNEWFLRIRRKLSPARQAEDTCIGYHSIAMTLRYMGRIEEAESYFDKAHAQALDYFEKTGCIRAREFLAVTSAERGRVALNKKDYIAAKEHLSFALTEFSDIVNRCGSKYSVSWQSTVLSCLASIAKDEGRYDDEMQFSEQRIICLKRATEKRNDLHLCSTLGLAYSDYAVKLIKRHRNEEALAAYTNAAEQHEIACGFTDHQAQIRFAARSRQTEGDYAKKLGLYEMSKASYNKALDHFLSIVAPIASDRKSVIALCESLGADAHGEDAVGLYITALRYYDGLLKDNPDDEELIAARARTERAVEIARSSIEDDEDYDSLDALIEELVAGVFDDEDS